MKKMNTFARVLLSTALVVLSHGVYADSTINVGYQIDYDYVYPYDGIGGLGADTEVSAVIMVTPDMLSSFVGARVKALRIGWADPEHSAKCTAFIRKSLYSTGEVVAQGEGTLKYFNDGSWNVINFAEPYVITGEDITLWAGYSTTIKKNTYAISTMYPHNQPGSCFVWRADLPKDENGNELWSDLNDMGTLSVQLVVEGPDELLKDKLDVDWFYYSPIVEEGKPVKGYMNLKNRGSNAIKSFTIECQQGEQTTTQTINLQRNLAAGATLRQEVSFKVPANGKCTYTITKVGGAANHLATPNELNVLTIPSDVAKEYKRRPLVEFYESEGNHLVPSYYDEIFKPGFLPFSDQLILVSQHTNDQFMTGMDEELSMMIDLAGGNTSLVTIPAMTVDRMPGFANPVASPNKSYYDVLYDNFVGMYAYQPALTVPTCANADIEVEMTPGTREGNVTVSGHIAEGVMGDEPLFLTLYLIEDQVESNSQDKPITYDDDDKDKDKGEEFAPGYYVHDNVIRWRMTPMYGVNIGCGGDYSKTFDFELEDEWKFDDIRFVAVVNRGKEGNDHMHMSVMNAAQVLLRDVADGIREPMMDDESAVWYDLMGHRLTSPAQANGIAVRVVDGKASKVIIR